MRAPSARLATFVIAIGLGAPAASVAQKAPDGFRVELLFKVPDVEHPSVVTCDDEGNLFVGEDPMDMRGPTTKEFDRILLFQWDKAGGAPKRTVFADNLSAVFGMVWHEGALYVMHAPHYTMFKDLDGDGVADVRKDLADGFGPAAGIFGFNDHIVTGTRLGMDGRLYVSVGDKGVPKATGSDGSTISLEGGGVIRMKLDGSKLEIISSGTRNHLDVAIDELDNIFTYDNTDDGLGWWTRLTHHIPTGYYGYPYDYHPHPDRHLPRISEHGGGSPCGAACYRGAAWPAKYHNAAFFCEWGKRKVQCFHFQPKGATFEAEIEDFLVPDGDGEFRPIDVCFSPDGKNMYLADWQFGGWTRPDVVGRVFRITYVGKDVAEEPPTVAGSAPIAEQIRGLGHPNFDERMRIQWRLARVGKPAIEPVTEALFGHSSSLAKIHALWTLHALANETSDYDPTPSLIAGLGDADPLVRAQAARALGLRRCAKALPKLTLRLKDEDPRVRLWAAIALGRIGDRPSSAPLLEALGESDVFARFAMIQALRAINEWSAALPELAKADEPRRAAIVRALTGQYDLAAVTTLWQWATSAPTPADRMQALAALAEVHRKSAPYVQGWWGTQPARNPPARPKNQDWLGTLLVAKALEDALRQPAPEVRVAAMRSLRTVPAPACLPLLRRYASKSPDGNVQREAIATLAALKDHEIVPTLGEVALAANEPTTREAAVRAIVAIGAEGADEPLAKIADSSDAPPNVVQMSLDALAQLKSSTAREAIQRRLKDDRPAIRASAIQAFGKLAGKDALSELKAALADPNPEVRRSSAVALRPLELGDALPALATAANDPETRIEAILTLAAHPDRRALGAYLDGLVDKNPELRGACRSALESIRDAIGDDILALSERNELPAAVRRELQPVFASPQPVRAWSVSGPWPRNPRPEFDAQQPPDLNATFAVGDQKFGWKQISTDDPMGKIDLRAQLAPRDDVWAVAYAAIEADEAGVREAIVGSDDQLILFVNGQKVYEFLGDRGWGPDHGHARFDVRKGTNHVWAWVGNSGGPWAFSARFSHRDPKFAFLEKDAPAKLEPAAYAEFAAKTPGDAARGKKLFDDANGVGCVKCHTVGGGAKVGPDLAGIGAKYLRPELVRSILEPSNRVLSGYEVSVIATADGKTLTGIVKRETDEGIELATADGKTISIPADEIEAKKRDNLSLMPNGLKDGLSLEEFADIVAYLESLK